MLLSGRYDCIQSVFKSELACIGDKVKRALFKTEERSARDRHHRRSGIGYNYRAAGCAVVCFETINTDVAKKK